MKKLIDQIRLQQEVYDSIYNAPIKQLNRIYYTTGLIVVKGKKGREKGRILLKNDTEKNGQ